MSRDRTSISYRRNYDSGGNMVVTAIATHPDLRQPLSAERTVYPNSKDQITAKMIRTGELAASAEVRSMVQQALR